MKEVNTQNFWTVELGIQGGNNSHIWVYVVFEQSVRHNDQNLNNDTFYRMPVTSCQVVIGTEKNPDFAILLNYDDDVYSQACG